MIEIQLYVTITISLLGVAYPILLQVIARLDEKYSSERIVSLYNTEFEAKLFKAALISSLILIVIWTLKLEPIIYIDKAQSLINNSAGILVIASTIILVIAFFLFVRKIIIYYTPTKFINHLQTFHKKSKDDFKYFEALCDMLLLSIRKQERNIAITLSDFFYGAFRSIREKSPNEPVVYPDLYYDIVFKSLEELVVLKEKRNYYLEKTIGGSIWLLGELQGNQVSEKTYSYIWRNILLSIQFQHDDTIVNHWITAHQFYSFSLPYIHESYNYLSETSFVSNKEAVDQRIKDRERFIEFHFALGGLLIYSKRYACLERLFAHTNSQPPKYELLPETMQQIFTFYFKIRDPYDRRYTWISHQYPFPNLSGLNADSVIIKYISSYMALLLLRQYKLWPYYTGIQPIDYPNIPETQGKIKEWIDGSDFLKKMVSQHLSNKDLLAKIELDFLTEEWCIENNKIYPEDFIDNFKNMLQEAYQNNALNLPLFQPKIDQFANSTRKIIESTFENFKRISNTGTIQGNIDKYYIHGKRTLQSKDAFSENPEVSFMDFDSYLASFTAKNIEDGISSTFLFKKTKTYLLKPEFIFKGIDRLGLDDSYVLIGFGINIDYYIKHHRVPGLLFGMYNDVNLYIYNGSETVNSCIFVIKKSELPKFSAIPIPIDVRQKYDLHKLGDELELFYSVMDLNAHPEILEELRSERSEEELRKSVLLNIIMTIEILWKKNVEVIQFMEYSEYIQRGILNNISEVEALKKIVPPVRKGITI